MENYPNPT